MNIKNIIFIILGSFFLIIGFIGAFIPILPTTPLIMLACYFFASGNKKFHDKLINSKFYAKHVKDFIEKKELTLKRKIFLLTFASTMLLFPLIILDFWLKFIIILLYIFLYYYFICKIKTTKITTT